MPRPHFRPITDKTVVSVLDFIRAVIVRDGLEGVEHADALLRLWGTDPASLPVPLKRPRHFKRSELRWAILAALRESGPLTSGELAKRVGDGLEPRAAYKRTYAALYKLRVAGVVAREERMGRWVWKLA